MFYDILQGFLLLPYLQDKYVDSLFHAIVIASWVPFKASSISYGDGGSSSMLA